MSIKVIKQARVLGYGRVALLESDLPAGDRAYKFKVTADTCGPLYFGNDRMEAERKYDAYVNPKEER